MPDKTYRIVYEAPQAKINRDLDAIMSRLTKLDQLAEKVDARLKKLGGDMPGVKRAIADLVKLDVELRSKVTDADRAEKALKEVGKGNNSIGTMTARLKALEEELKKVAAAAEIAKVANAGVGAGPVNGVGGGPAPAGGNPPAPKPGQPARPAAGLGGAGAMAMMAGASIARAGLQEAAEGAQRGRDYFTASTAKVTELRDQAREYAALRKQPGPNDKILREITDFGKQTGATPEDSVKFLATYEGSATTGRDKGNIGGVVGQNGFTAEKQEALEARLRVVGGQFGMRTGLDARTAGDLTAVVSTYKKINNEADLAGQLAGAHYGIDQGRGEISPLARSELGQAGSAIESGRVSGLPELGAFVGVASVASKSAGSSGTTYGQLSRFLNETGAGNEEQEQFIKDSGMGAAKGDFNKLKAFRDYMARIKPDDANTFLESKGYGNSTDRRSALGMIGNVDVLQKRIAEANRIAGDGQAALDRNAENQRQVGTVGDKARAGEFAVDIEAGIQNEKLQIGRTAALGRLKDPTQPGGPQIYTPRASIVDAMRTAAMMGSSTGEQERIDMEAIDALSKGGSKVGLDIPKMFPGLMKTGLARDANSDTERRQQFSQAYDLIESKGGDPMGGDPAKNLQKAAGFLQAAAAGLNQQKGGGGGMPNGPFAGNGGAGFVPGRR